jgi:hypothetical protein
MEEAQLIWFQQAGGRDLAVTEELMIEQAKILGERAGVAAWFASRRWLQGLKKRRGLGRSFCFGNAASADQDGFALAQVAVRQVLADGGCV